MSPSELLKIAGDAAIILDTMGYTSVARLKEGVVALDLWRVVDKRQLRLRHVVDETITSPHVLAQSCAFEFRVHHKLMPHGAGQGM